MKLYRRIIENLLSYPSKGQIQVRFDLKRKIFLFTAPIFSSKKELPRVICEYVEKRKDHTFAPYTTSFKKQKSRVLLTQEIPFSLDFQKTLRTELVHFCNMSKRCHKMFSEMALEERLKETFSLFE